MKKIICKRTCFLFFVLIGLLAISCNAENNKNRILSLRNTEDKFPSADCVIDSIIDLKGGTISLPPVGNIKFTGKGGICNGTVFVDNSTYNIEGGYNIFSNIKLRPSRIVSNDDKVSLPLINARWFGAANSKTRDNTKSLQSAIDAAHSFSVPIYLPRGYYIIKSALKLHKGDILKGEDAGLLHPGHQKGATFIRYVGNEKEMISVMGDNVSIENIIIAADIPYLIDGIKLYDNSGVYFCMDNVVIANAKNGVSYLMGDKCGFSGCLWNKVSIWNCVRGISVDLASGNGQYITYNNFNNLSISEIKEKGVYLHSKSINSTTFRDCLFANIGYGTAYDTKYAGAQIFAIEANNEANQGSLLVDGGYFENIYPSKGGELQTAELDFKNSVFLVKNMNVSIYDVRFANTRTVITSLGRDYVKISNCIDNGFHRNELKDDVFVCRLNSQSIARIDGYSFSNENKIILTSDNKSNIKAINIRDASGKIYSKP